MMKWLQDFPSTNGRIVTTLAVFVGTAVRYLGWDAPTRGWESWLTAVVVMAGVDGAVYTAKRLTYKPSPPAPPDVEDTSTPPTVPRLAASDERGD